MKSFVRDKIEGDAEFSGPEDGDEAYAKEIKAQDKAEIEANNGQLGKAAMAALEENRIIQA